MDTSCAHLKHFGIARAAVLRTYGLTSAQHFLMAKTTIDDIRGTLMLDSTLRAIARISGLLSVRSFWNVLIESKARSGSDSAYRRM